jgi:hypothetical protein
MMERLLILCPSGLTFTGSDPSGGRVACSCEKDGLAACLRLTERGVLLPTPQIRAEMR